MNILQECMQMKGYIENIFEWLPMGEEEKASRERKEENASRERKARRKRGKERQK